MDFLSLKANLEEAADLFVMKKFERCFGTCKSVIKTAKYEPEQERNNEVIEAATALGIQALAETDNWHCTVDFINDVYGTIDICPPRIIQVCIFLHAHVQEYLPCHRLVQIWLKNPENLSDPQCSKVVKVYARHILCPTGSYGVLKEVVENCPSLTETERAALLQLPQAGRYEEAKMSSDVSFKSPPSPIDSLENKFSDLINFNASNPQDSEVTSSNFLQHTDDSDVKEEIDQEANYTEDEWPLLGMYQRWCQSVISKLCSLRYSRYTVFILGALALWALIQTQTGDPVSSLNRFVILWKAFLQKLGLLGTK